MADRLGIRNATGRPIRFAPAEAAGVAAYEAHIARTGEVPTRDNRHDFFNALVWLAFPRTKARLNALQAQAIAATGIGAQRGPLRDAATLIDENAVLLVTQRADIVDALSASRLACAVRRTARRVGTDVRPVVFGHALMEKLGAPYKAVTAHALPVRLAADASLADIDAQVAAALEAGADAGPAARRCRCSAFPAGRTMTTRRTTTTRRCFARRAVDRRRDDRSLRG